MHEGGERALFAVLSGRVETVRREEGADRIIGGRGPGEVFGEIPITLGMVFPAGFRAVETSRIMRLDPSEYYAVVAAAPDVGQEVGRLAAHRLAGPGGLQAIAAAAPRPRAFVVGHRWDAACTELRRFLHRNRITFRWLDVEAPETAQEWWGPLPDEGDYPAIRVVNGKTVVKPQLRRVAELLDLATEPEAAEYDTVIVGAGPAGLAARSEERRVGKECRL